jgi:hypothetical protein
MQSMKYSETCACCAHTATAYTHNLNKPLISALKQLVEFYQVNYRRANLQKDLMLTKNQYNNFQKLQYFGLVHREAGGYVPTSKGTAFIKGTGSTQDIVATLGKNILDQSHPAWSEHSRTPKEVRIYDYFPEAYKQREEYQDEKSRTLFN